MNILLVCSAGMSTGMIVKKMQAAAEKSGIDSKIWAVGDSVADQHIPEADVVLIGPQVRFLLEKIKAMAGGKPVASIDMRDYGTMNGEKILNDAIKMLEDK